MVEKEVESHDDGGASLSASYSRVANKNSITILLPGRRRREF